MKHTEESKLKLSIARKNYLKNNPEAKIWQTKQAGTSIPCERFKELLSNNDIKYISEFEPLRHKNRYFSIDIAFPDKKIGIEINGRQHYDNLGKLKPYYQSRHDLIESEGWKLYEIPYHYAFNKTLMLEMVNKILNSESKIEFNYELYKRKPRKKYMAKLPNNKKYQYPENDILTEMAKNLSLQDLSKKLNIPKKALWFHLKKRKILTKKRIRKLKPSEINPNWRHEKKIKSRKYIRPTKEELQKLILEKPFLQIAKDLNVGSDNTIRKWCLSYGLEIPKFGRGFWSKKW